MTKKAMVTGGWGFIGAHLVSRLLSENWDVTVLDDGSAGVAENLSYLGVAPEMLFVDLVDPQSLKSLTGPPFDAIFHLAGNANVPRSVENPAADFKANVVATMNVLEFARDTGVRKVVFPSTASVYKPGVPMPVKEDAPICASSPYGAAKIAAENYCYAYATCYGLDVTVLRFFNVYGPLMRRFVIHDMVRKLQRQQKRLEILGDGEQVREYLHVDDAARAFLLAAEKGAPGVAYNVGTGVPVRIRDLAKTISTLMGLDGVDIICTMESWPGDVKAWYADTQKFSQLGFSPRVPWDRGLRQTVEYLLSEG